LPYTQPTTDNKQQTADNNWQLATDSPVPAPKTFPQSTLPPMTMLTTGQTLTPSAAAVSATRAASPRSIRRFRAPCPPSITLHGLLNPETQPATDSGKSIVRRNSFSWFNSRIPLCRLTATIRPVTHPLSPPLDLLPRLCGQPRWARWASRFCSMSSVRGSPHP